MPPVLKMLLWLVVIVLANKGRQLLFFLIWKYNKGFEFFFATKMIFFG
jgi:hypothetical protein